MRCPYCGGLNSEQSIFCVNCGRDLTNQAPTPQFQRQKVQPVSRGAVPPPPPPRPSNQPVQPVSTTANRRRPVPSPVEVQKPVAEPDPPGPFPPRTMKQFTNLLVEGAQPYTLIESHVENGKKIVNISYKRCAGWQQAATLLKAFKEYDEEKFETTIIQGTLDNHLDIYAFTNGQLQLNRHVRLGGQLNDRYIVETNDGFDVGSVRFVLNV